MNKADALYNSSAYAESTQTYKEAFKIEQKSYSDLYNAACSASLAGDTKLALEWLEKSIDYGWTNISHLKIDTDLNALHDLKEWPILLEKLQKMLDVIERNYDKPLQQELLKINEDDQKYRMQLDEVEKKYGYNSPQMQEIWQIIGEKDSINLVKVKSILDKHGWVGPDIPRNPTLRPGHPTALLAHDAGGGKDGKCIWRLSCLAGGPGGIGRRPETGIWQPDRSRQCIR